MKDDKQRFREVPMSLDTLFADLDEGKLYLTWRGLDAIETDDTQGRRSGRSSPRRSSPTRRCPRRTTARCLEAFEADPLEIKDRVPGRGRSHSSRR